MGLDDLPEKFSIAGGVDRGVDAFQSPASPHGQCDPNPNPHTPALLIAFLLGAIFVGCKCWYIDWGSTVSPASPDRHNGIRGFRDPIFRDRASAQAAAVAAAMLGIFSPDPAGQSFPLCRIIHYGCWLAMPATMLLVIALSRWIPEAIGRRGGSPAAFLAGAGGAWAAVLRGSPAISGIKMKPLTVSVGFVAYQFWADPMRGNCVNNAVIAAEQIPPDNTIACFPEGIIINYLSRRRTPTPYVNFNPPDLLLFGENRMITALNDSPPDFVFLVHKDTSEFGERFFGHDYGQKLNAWIEERYVEESLPTLDLGSEPFRTADLESV